MIENLTKTEKKLYLLGGSPNYKGFNELCKIIDNYSNDIPLYKRYENLAKEKNVKPSQIEREIRYLIEKMYKNNNDYFYQYISKYFNKITVKLFVSLMNNLILPDNLNF